MSFNHTNTFLRSALLENPDFLGDLLQPEDVLRIESEYPELFTAAFDAENVNKKTLPSKLPFRIPDRFTRLSQSAKTCNRQQCKPPNTIQPRKTTAFVQQQKDNKFAHSKIHASGSSNLSPRNAQITVTRTKNFIIKNDSIQGSPFSTAITSVSSPTLKFRVKQEEQEKEKQQCQRQSAQKDQQLVPASQNVKARKSLSAPVKITNSKFITNGGSGQPCESYQRRHPEHHDNNRHHAEHQQPQRQQLDAPPPRRKLPEKQIGLRSTKTNIPVASFSEPASPRTARKDVTTRHASKSKSHGFLKPVPILLKKKSPVSPRRSDDYDKERHKLMDKLISTFAFPTPSTSSLLPNNADCSPIADPQKLLDSIRSGHGNKSKMNFKELLQKEREIALNLSDILEERETETEMSTHKDNSEYSDSFISTCSSISVGALRAVMGRNESEQHSIKQLDFVDQGDDSLINIKSDFQFKDPILQQDRQSYLAQASLNRCEQLLLTKILASKYEKEGKFIKTSAENGNSNNTHKNSPKNETKVPVQIKSEIPSASPSRSKPCLKVISTHPSSTSIPRPPSVQSPAPAATSIHDAILENFVQQNKSFQTVLNEKPRLLEEIAHELIYAEVLKILHEEHALKSYKSEMKSPVMINKCVGTTSRSKPKLKSPSKSSHIPIVSPTLSVRSNVNSNLNSNSKIKCEVKPRSRNSISESEPLSDSKDKYKDHRKDESNSQSKSESKKSSEIQSLEMDNDNSAFQNFGENENDGIDNYSDNFDEITGSNPPEQLQPAASTSESNSKPASENNTRYNNGNIILSQTSKQSPTRSKTHTESNSKTPSESPRKSAPVVSQNHSQHNIKDPSVGTSNKNASVDMDKSQSVVGKEEEEVVIVPIEKLDKTECDCSELDDDDDIIASETAQSVDDGKIDVDAENEKSSQVEQSQPEESIEDVIPPAFSTPNSYADADVDIASGKISHISSHDLSPLHPGESQSISGPSPSLTKESLAPLSPVDENEERQGEPLLPSVTENQKIVPTAKTKKKSVTYSYDEISKAESEPKPRSRSQPTPKPHPTELPSSSNTNLGKVNNESDNMLPILKLLEEAEKLHEDDGDDDDGDEAVSISVPLGSEHEEKLYKEIIAEINSSQADSSIRSNDGDLHNLNIDTLDVSISQGQFVEKDKTEVESSCASILDGFISEGELVVDDSEEKSPGEIYSGDFNGYNFSPGFYSKVINKM